MELDNSNEIDIDIFKNKKMNESLSTFINELTNELKKHENNKKLTKEEYIKDNRKELSEGGYNVFEDINNIGKPINVGDVCVVQWINKELVSFIDSTNGKEFDIYFAKDDETYQKLIDYGFEKEKIYRIDKETFYYLDIGDRFIKTENGYEVYNGEFDLDNIPLRSATDTNAWEYLEEIYSGIEADEGQEFVVDSLTEEKAILKYPDGSGLLSVYREVYPELEVRRFCCKKR